jgi:hypothetical protein
MMTESLDNIQHFAKDTNCILLLKKYATLLTVFMVIGYVLDVGSTALFGLLADNFGVGECSVLADHLPHSPLYHEFDYDSYCLPGHEKNQQLFGGNPGTYDLF